MLVRFLKVKALLALALLWAGSLARAADYNWPDTPPASLAHAAQDFGGLTYAEQILTPEETTKEKAPSPFMELRLGAYVHDLLSPEKGDADLNAEAVFSAFAGGDNLYGLLIPRLHIGGTASFTGKTSFAYAGFTWTLPLNEKFFLEAAFGGAIHNGLKDGGEGRNAMGCPWSFHESLSLGYRLARDWSVLGTIEHVSNAGLCEQNRGLTNFGLRLSRAF